MKRIYSLLFSAAALFGAISCDKANNENPDVEIPTEDVLYVLNNGNFGSNNSSLTSYSFLSESVVSECVFTARNGQGLGDTAQDILIFGDKMFITVYNSGVIFVTELDGTIVKTIVDETFKNPRYFTADKESVYVGYYDGAVAKINPETYAVTKCDANINPEKLVAVDGKLYVTVSQGMGNTNACNTIDVYETSTMTFSKSIEVILNPTAIEADSHGNIYVISMGNYGYGVPPISPTLQKINIATEESEILSMSGIEGATPTNMVMNDDTLYVIEGVTDPATWTTVAEVYAYDTKSGDSNLFVTDGTEIENKYSISADKATGEVYVGTSDYTATGDLYVFSAEGKLEHTIAVGLNPLKAVRADVPSEE